MKVSIITVTYNAGQWVDATIQSVLSQSNTDYEYLIVDGNSTDNTVTIAESYRQEFQGRLRIVSEPDNGLYDAMNKGIRYSKGDYLWFVNAGDRIFDADTLQRIVVGISEGACIIYGKASIISPEGKVVSEHHKTTPYHLSRSSFLNGLVVSHQAIIVSKKIAPMYDTSYKISADYDWVVKCVSACKNSVYIDDYLCQFMTGGVSASKRTIAWKERFIIMRRHYGLFLTIMAHCLIAIKYPFSIKY